MNIIARKLFTKRNLRKLIHLIINVLLGMTLLPVYFGWIFLCALYLRLVGCKECVIFAGLEHVIEKTVNRSDFFKEKGFAVRYYSFETTGNRSPRVNTKEVIIASRIIAIDVIKFCFICITSRPIYIELYFEQSGINQFFYALFGRLAGVLVVSIYRGGEFYFYSLGRRVLYTHMCVIVAKISNIVCYRELYMKKYLDQFNLRNRSVFDYNKVRVGDEPEYWKNDNNVLFLNGVKDFRRVDLLLAAIPHILKSHPSASFTIVGCLSNRAYDHVIEFAKNIGVDGVVHVEYWIDNPHDYYQNAKIFILPADIVFCNYSLLESMERGIPAVVANVEDADKIIKHGYNGYLTEQTPEAIAFFICELLSDEEKRIQMGKNARETIITQFNDKDRMAKIWEVLERHYLHKCT